MSHEYLGVYLEIHPQNQQRQNWAEDIDGWGKEKYGRPRKRWSCEAGTGMAASFVICRFVADVLVFGNITSPIRNLCLMCSKQPGSVNSSFSTGKCSAHECALFLRKVIRKEMVKRGTVGTPADDDTSSSEDVAPSKNVDLSCCYTNAVLSSAVSVARGMESPTGYEV